jgi:hypothetical protein
MGYVLQLSKVKQLASILPRDTDFKEPTGIIKKNCYFGRIEYFIKGTETKVNCQENLSNSGLTPTPSQ